MPYHRKYGRKAIVEINMVPFIDVMLVLLVIFMITTPLLTQGVKVELPKTSASTLPKDQKEPLIVTIDAKGNYFLNISDKPNQPISSQTLSFLTAQQLKNNPEDQRPVLVRGDKEVNYGTIMAAMSLLKTSGAKSVGLITEEEIKKIENSIA